MTSDKKSGTKIKMLKSAVVCTLVIAAGFTAMNVMARMKKPPEVRETQEAALKVKILNAQRNDIRVSISAYGEVSSLNTVNISPEVSGLVTYVHPELEAGEIITEGEVLFKIDSADFETDLETYSKRLKVSKRNARLAQNEYQRIRKLYDKNNTGTLSDVEKAESSWNNNVDTVAQLEKLFQDTKKNLDRCTVKAPFNARIENVNLEKGQFVPAGVGVVSVADDSVLEVKVPVDTTEALMVLDFVEQPDSRKSVLWFGNVKKNECEIVWAESGRRISVTGYLHRVVKYDSSSRTVYLAVRIDSKSYVNSENYTFPIVDGMFCEVVIPGRTMENVIKVPAHAVSYDGKVKLAENGRLKTVPVNVAWKEGDYSIISGGLSEGDKVITTRLSSPLENSLLEVSETVMLAAE